jgi:hypothetical protein
LPLMPEPLPLPRLTLAAVESPPVPDVVPVVFDVEPPLALLADVLPVVLLPVLPPLPELPPVLVLWFVELPPAPVAPVLPESPEPLSTVQPVDPLTARQEMPPAADDAPWLQLDCGP